MKLQYRGHLIRDNKLKRNSSGRVRRVTITRDELFIKGINKLYVPILVCTFKSLTCVAAISMFIQLERGRVRQSTVCYEYTYIPELWSTSSRASLPANVVIANTSLLIVALLPL